MPELPDVTLYVEALNRRLAGEVLERVRLSSPFLLRSVDPPVAELEGRKVTGVSHLAKRLVFAFEDELFCVIHLMIAGRFQWRAAGAKLGSKSALAGFDFAHGTLVLTEAGSKKRASMHLVRGRDGLEEHERGGLDVMTASRDEFVARLTENRHTLKRALCDPKLFSGIGNAYSDEILHAARLSPMQLTTNLDDAECTTLHESTVRVLETWIARLREQTGEDFPTKVTAFRPEMAVHGRYGQPCPDCAAPVQRIVYASNETNYCANCQTGGKLLADRALSRLLKKDWPKSLDEL